MRSLGQLELAGGNLVPGITAQHDGWEVIAPIAAGAALAGALALGGRALPRGSTAPRRRPPQDWRVAIEDCC